MTKVITSLEIFLWMACKTSKRSSYGAQNHVTEVITSLERFYGSPRKHKRSLYGGQNRVTKVITTLELFYGWAANLPKDHRMVDKIV